MWYFLSLTIKSLKKITIFIAATQLPATQCSPLEPDVWFVDHCNNNETLKRQRRAPIKSADQLGLPCYRSFIEGKKLMTV